MRQQRPRTRRPPGIPRRGGATRDNAEKGKRIPTEAREPTVNTVERYSHTNDDGSFTFGYIAEDGSFREETRGVDCITRGKYGYIDPDGKKREFTYVSGLPCDPDAPEDDGLFDSEENELAGEDPINPGDRFRTSAPVQLNPEEIPEAARPRQRRPQRPQQEEVGLRQEPGQDFQNFQRPPVTRVRDPALRNRIRPRPGQANSGALQSLLNIANDDEQLTLSPTPAPVRPRPRPRPTAAAPRRPTPAPVRPTPGPVNPANAFDFDAELDDFTLNRPALTFDKDAPEANRAQDGAPAQVGPNFSTELVFDPASGTFKTELRQVVAGGEVRVADDAAPSGAARPAVVPTARPVSPAPQRPIALASPTPLAPTARPFTAFATAGSPSPTTPFAPLTFPSPTTPRPASPRPTTAASPVTTAAPAVTTPRPTTPTPPAARPVTPGAPGSGSFFFQPFPTVGSPRPIGASATPTAQRPAQATPTQAVRPAGTFINFGGSPQPAFVAQPRPVTPQATPTAAAPTPIRTASPAPPRPQPQAARPASPAPAQAARPTPTVQFGFQPIQQQQQRPAGRPFTAFASGQPPQFSGVPRPQAPQARPPVQSRPPPQQGAFRPAQGASFFGQPPRPAQAPRPQGRPQQLGIPPQLQGQPQATRFSPFGRPPPQQSSSPFTVFNPAALRGARFFN